MLFPIGQLAAHPSDLSADVTPSQRPPFRSLVKEYSPRVICDLNILFISLLAIIPMYEYQIMKSLERFFRKLTPPRVRRRVQEWGAGVQKWQ